MNTICFRSIKQGNAEGTRENRRTHERAYQRFCTEFVYDPYPADEWRLVQFAQFLFQENKKPETISNYISSIRVLHRLAGLQCPPASQVHFQLLMQGLQRQCTRPIIQADPIDHPTLKRLFKHVDVSKELHAVAWTAVLVGFNLVLRVSNLGPSSRGKFDPNKHLLRSDYAVRQGYPTIGIRWSKTNQYRNRVNWAPILQLQDRQISPLWWVQKMLANIPAEPHELMFLVREKGERYPLTAGQIRRLLKEWTEASAVELRLMPHCLRRGALNWAHDANLTGESLKVLGDWFLSAYQKYLDIGFNSRVRSGEVMASFANKLH